MTFLLHDVASGITQNDRAYAETKAGKLTRLLPNLRTVQLVHRTDRSDHCAELHLQSDGIMIRICGKAKSVREAVDTAFDRAAGKLRRLRDRSVRRRGN
jgi:ribosomal subunit interface protein